MSVNVRIGIVGLGAASRQIAPGFDDVEGVKLTAVCDVRPEAVRQFEEVFDVEGFSSLEDMCKHGGVDAVYIATPNNLHADHTIMVADQGKHVICEKPMAITMDQANRMVEAVQRNGVRYVQGHSKIYGPAIKLMGEVIKSGRLGRVIQINALQYKGWMRSPWEAASLDPARGGGVLYRQGPHQMDIIRYVGGGMVRSVRGITGRWNPHFDVEGDYSAFMEFENGAGALVSFIGYGHFEGAELTWGIAEGGGVRSDQVLLGPRRKPTAPVPAEEYYAREEFSTDALRKRIHARPLHQDFFGLTIVSCERGDIRQSPDGIYVYTEDGREEILVADNQRHRGSAEAYELVASIEENRPVFPDAGWGRASLEACVGIMESSHEHREVQLQYQVPSPIAVPVASLSS